MSLEQQKVGVITAARNEQEHLPRLADSILTQKRTPDFWCIVDDGSTDNTSKIAQRLKEKYSWIHVINRADRGYNSRGKGNIDALSEGIAITRQVLAPTIIATLDADLSFDSNVFTALIQAFEHSGGLGIWGGDIVEERPNGEWKPPVQLPTEFVRAAFKTYRTECYDQIGGVKSIRGWSAIDNMVALMNGWDVVRDSSVPIKHHRPKGKNDGIKDHMKAARNAYYMNSDPLLVIARGLRRMGAEKPYFIGGLLFLMAFTIEKIKHKEQFPDEKVLAFINKRHRQLLKNGYYHW